MFTKFRNALHEKVHGAKVQRQKKQFSPEVDENQDDDEGFTTSSASSSDSEHDDSGNIQDHDSLQVEFTVEHMVDLRGAPAYFYLCVGQVGDPTSKKKKRGIHTSKIQHSRNPIPSPDKSTFILSLSGLSQPEVTVRVSRSSIVGPDSFLGESRFPINLSQLSSNGPIVSRLAGGCNAMISVHWTLVHTSARKPLDTPPLSHPPSYRFPPHSRDGLVETVCKVLYTPITGGDSADDDRLASINWLANLVTVVPIDEFNHLCVNVSMTELLKLSHRNESLFNALRHRTTATAAGLSVAVRARFIKGLHVRMSSTPNSGNSRSNSISDDGDDQQWVGRLFTSCPLSELPSLKTLVDSGGDKYSLFHLVYSAITSDLVRDLILDRFASDQVPSSVRLVSEIDQVIHSPFGSVKRWPEGQVPCAYPVYAALVESSLTFVNSRSINLESWTHRLIRDFGCADATLMTGSKFSDLYAMRGGLRQFQSQVLCSKYTNWSRYRRLYPEAVFIYIGESVDFAQTLVADEKGHGSSVKSGRLGMTIVMDDPATTAVDGVTVCGNFVQVAQRCFEKGFLTCEQILEMVPVFEQCIIKWDKASRKRHRQMARDRLSEISRDLNVLRRMVGSPVFGPDDHVIVDSMVLTPISPRSEEDGEDRRSIVVLDGLQDSM